MIAKVSSTYRITIPRALRKDLHIKPGDSFEVVPHEDRIELIPVRNIRTMRGFLRGMESTIERERDRL